MRNYSSIIAFLGILILIVIPIYQANNIFTQEVFQVPDILEVQQVCANITRGDLAEDYLDIVSKSFQATNGEFCELNIEAWAKINKSGIAAEELKMIYENIAKALSLGLRNMEIEEYEDFLSIYGNDKVEDETYVQLILQSFYSKGLEAGTYLGIMINSNDLEKSRLWYNSVCEIFVNLEIPTEIGVTLVASISGELSRVELQKEANLALEACQAQVVEGINTPELLSLSGYTQNCKDYLEVNGKRININVALRYHIVNDETYIHLGAPLIFQEY